MSPLATEMAPPEAHGHDSADDVGAGRRHEPDAVVHVRATDIEPYIGLRYLSKLFRFMAIILVLLLIAEVVTGLVKQGGAAIPTLLGEMSRLIVLAGLLWGTGDLAILLIDVGHDVRATRILLGRQVAHHAVEHHAVEHHAVEHHGAEHHGAEHHADHHAADPHAIEDPRAHSHASPYEHRGR